MHASHHLAPHRPAPLRGDAEQNRARIIAAARAVFARWGTDASMSRVARHAGVSLATVYRRFPGRAALVAAAFDDQHAECRRMLDAIERHPDPWGALRGALVRLCADQVHDKGFTAHVLAAGGVPGGGPDAGGGRGAAGGTGGGDRPGGGGGTGAGRGPGGDGGTGAGGLDVGRGALLERLRADIGRLDAVIDRAHSSGALRRDVGRAEFCLLVAGNAGVIEAAGPASPAASRRYVEMVLRSFAARRD